MARVKTRIELDRTYVLAVAASFAAPRVFETTRAVMNRSMVLTPVRTGNLRASHRMIMRVRRTRVVGQVETKVKYARWVHDGTRAHLIAARKPGGSLRFIADGQVIFRRVVRHPGTKGRPFMRTALYEEAGKRGFKVTGGAVGTIIGDVI